MARLLLTDKFIRSVKPVDGTRVDYFDTAATGLALRVGASGKKSWSFTYSRPGSRRRIRATLGVYPALTLAKARQRAVLERARIAEGEGSQNAGAIERRAMTMGDLIDDYLARRARPHLRSATEIERRLNLYVRPEIGSVRLANLHRGDVVRLLDKVVDKGSPVEANRIHQIVRTMVRWAVGRGHLDADPLVLLAKPAEARQPRNRVLDHAEIVKLWGKLKDAPMSEATRRIVRLCLLTGQRCGEIAGSRRDEFDWGATTWRIPAERSKNKHTHVVPVTDMAAGIWRAAFTDAARDGAELVHAFPKPRVGQDLPIEAHAVATAVRRSQEHFGLPRWTTHDLRRTMATEMAAAGVDEMTIARVLNHRTSTAASVTAAVYVQHDFEPVMRAALDSWNERIRQILI